MKSHSTTRVCLFVGMTALNMAFMPALQAQTTTNTPGNPSGSEANSKAPDSSVAEQRDDSTGTSVTAASAPKKTASKNTANSLDKNPSMAATDSAEKSATKEPTTARTEERMGKREKGNSAIASSDKNFLTKSAEGGLTEVELGQIAQQKGSSEEVKQFGAQMASEHSKVNEELKDIAQKKGVNVPGKLDARHQATVDRFNKLSGRNFDRAYIHAMVKDHKEDEAEFRKASTSAQDPDVKAFAGKTLTVIQGHLNRVENLQSKLK